MDLAKASIEDFQPLIDESFTIDADDTGQLTLTEVGAKPQTGASQRQPFVLVFRADDGTVLPQSIYRLEHASIGALDIFLVPISQDDDHVLYEAVFS